MSDYVSGPFDPASFPSQVIPNPAVTMTMTVGADVSGQSALMLDQNGNVTPADPTRMGYEFAGISQQAGAAGTTIQVTISGIMTEPGWSWTPGRPVYVGALGALTQTLPATGYLHKVGAAISPTTILVQTRVPILLASGS